MLVDVTVGHSMFSFMYGFSGYNQINMDPSDAKKTVIQTPMGNFHHKVKMFSLKTLVPPTNAR